uniref:Uncharacterized protein n=1 Tax=Panagrolaimus sp. ES5 TaxID=591445 RepID=A0AC34FJX1_9BILA
MSTKDYCFSAKDNELFIGDNSIDKYSNLNLNQNYSCLNSDTVSSKCVKNDSNKFVNEDDTNKEKKNFNSFNKFATKTSSEYLNVGNDFDKKEFKEAETDSDINKLSLLISAYENSIENPIETSLTDNNADDKKGSKINKDFAGSLFEHSFELPRQMYDGNQDPEIMQFKASQKLLNPNEFADQKDQGLASSIPPWLHMVLSCGFMAIFSFAMLILCAKFDKKKEKKRVVEEMNEREKEIEMEELYGLHKDGETRMPIFPEAKKKTNENQPANSPVPSPTLSSLLATGFDFNIMLDEINLAKRLIDAMRNYVTYEAETAHENDPNTIKDVKFQKETVEVILSKMHTKLQELQPQHEWMFRGHVKEAEESMTHGNKGFIEDDQLQLSKKIEIVFTRPFKFHVVGYMVIREEIRASQATSNKEKNKKAEN